MTEKRGVGQRYRVFSPRGMQGGELVTVFDRSFGAEADLPALAMGVGTPLSVFVVAQEGGSVHLRTLTSQGKEVESDSAHLAALAALSSAGQLTDWAEVSGAAAEPTAAQYCGGEWLLSRGAPSVSGLELTLSALQVLSELGLEAQATQVAEGPHSTLLLELSDVGRLQSLAPDTARLNKLGRLTGTTGLVLYTRAAPELLPLRRADLSLRAFQLGQSVAEVVVSSDMAACLVTGVGARGLWPEESSVMRLAQLAPERPVLLTAQFSAVGETVWVGGRAEAQGDGSDGAFTP